MTEDTQKVLKQLVTQAQTTFHILANAAHATTTTTYNTQITVDKTSIAFDAADLAASNALHLQQITSNRAQQLKFTAEAVADDEDASPSEIANAAGDAYDASNIADVATDVYNAIATHVDNMSEVADAADATHDVTDSVASIIKDARREAEYTVELVEELLRALELTR